MKKNAYTDCLDCGTADSRDQSVTGAVEEMRLHLSFHPTHNVMVIVNQVRN